MALKKELYRKLLHLLIILFPISYCYLGESQSLIIFAVLALFVVPFDYLRPKNPKINKIFTKIFGALLGDHEKTSTNLSGISFILLAACINFAIFKKEIAITGFIILAISSSTAAIMGKKFPKRPFYEKSFAGSASFFFSALVILISCGIVWHLGAWFYIFGLFAVFCVTMFEARPSFMEINDNFSIPIGFSIIMTFFDLALNYNY